jgi:hypothetical protein
VTLTQIKGVRKPISDLVKDVQLCTISQTSPLHGRRSPVERGLADCSGVVVKAVES